MNLADFFTQGLALVGTFNLKIAAFLFLLCLIGEATVLVVPYLFETTWLLAGYQLSQRVLSPLDLALFMLTSMAGRQAGALILYYVSRSGSKLVFRYKEFFKARLDGNNTLPVRLIRRMDILGSPFSVALGRLLWLRIPLTLILGATRRLKTLLLGVAISSLVYDGVYVILGAIVGTTTVAPARLVLYSLAALTALYGGTFTIRQIIASLTKRHYSLAK